jgi:hypothetical protein
MKKKRKTGLKRRTEFQKDRRREGGRILMKERVK